MRGRIPKYGQLAGTGALISVNVGFRPVYVKVIDVTQLAQGQAIDSQASGNTILEVTAGTTSKLTTGGITITPTGFTIGTNANLNTASDEIHYVAF